LILRIFYLVSRASCTSGGILQQALVMTKSAQRLVVLAVIVLVAIAGVFLFLHNNGSSLSTISPAPQDQQGQSTTGTPTTAGTVVDNAPSPAADDLSMGEPNAPVTIIEYFSLSCPHCAHFAKDIFPQIKSTYIDTGKVRWIFRDFPLNKPALAAEQLAHCQPALRYAATLDFFFSNQDQWLIEQYEPVLTQLAKGAGMDDAGIQQCLNDQALRQKIVASRTDAANKYGVDATPTFFIGKVKIAGAEGFDTFRTVIENQLKQK
jgi:protein-disulfide isomerase